MGAGAIVVMVVDSQGVGSSPHVFSSLRYPKMCIFPKEMDHIVVS